MLKLGKNHQMLKMADSRSGWCGEEAGTGKSNVKNDIFGPSHGVPFPAPFRFKMNADGAGKPEVKRKGRAT